MKFQYKCFLQHFFSNIPKGEIFNYLFQKYITRSLPLSNDYFLNKVRSSYNHYLKFKKYNTLKQNGHQYYEFGAGWDLITPITMALLGFNVTCIDQRRLVFNQLITDTIAKFINNTEHIPFPINRLELKKKKNQLNYLKDRLNFTYIAPLDARKTKFNTDHFDLVTSSVTFEHIPEQDLYLILNETYRILKHGGILLITIDYKDHWSYFDKSISIYNFLKYSNKTWERFNPSLHFQNRLRHKDYLKIISKTNFKIMEEVPALPSDSEIKILENLNIDDRYKEYSINELSIKSSQIVLKK